MPDAVHIQIRKHAGNIVQQDPVASHDIKILRAETILIIVQNIRDPVHGYRGFSGTGHSLDNHIMIGRFADNLILFFLNRGYNLSQHSLFVARQIFGQQIIVGNHFTVKIVQKLSLLNLIGTFQLQIDIQRLSVRGLIAALAQTIFIIDIGHRRAPVYDCLMGSIAGDSSFADIE